MMTLEQIKICQRLGLNCNWALQNYSYHMTNAGLAVTGAGALGGALLSQLKYNSDKKKLEKEGKDTSHMSRLKYAAGGAALGGAAGFGTQHMLKTDANKMKNDILNDIRTNKSGVAKNKNTTAVAYKDNKGIHYGLYDENTEDVIPGAFRSNRFGIRGKINGKHTLQDGLNVLE